MPLVSAPTINEVGEADQPKDGHQRPQMAEHHVVPGEWNLKELDARAIGAHQQGDHHLGGQFPPRPQGFEIVPKPQPEHRQATEGYPRVQSQTGPVLGLEEKGENVNQHEGDRKRQTAQPWNGGLRAVMHFLAAAGGAPSPANGEKRRHRQQNGRQP